MQKIFKAIKKEIRKHRFVYLLFGIILIGALLARLYRTDQVLGFYFDQGRDALVIWDFLYNGKFFLIGPTTGIAGIFRGPFYYYLITPFYWLGNGSPVFPAVFLALTTVIAIVVMFYLAKIMQDRTSGILASIIVSFSFFMIVAARWLSNPTPMLLLSMLLLLVMILIMNGKKWGWFALSFLSGVSLFHFGSSGEFFYFPALFVFAIWQRKKWPSIKGIISCLFIFLFTASPLILFDVRHDGILLGNLKKFFVDDQSFKASFWQVAQTRFEFYYDVFASKLFPIHPRPDLLILLGIAFVVLLPSFLKNKYIKVLLLMLVSPVVGLLFFQGNFGNIYDYYLTGYYMMFLLIVGLILGKVWRNPLGKVFVLFFLFVFLRQNLEVTKSRVSDTGKGPETIILQNQKEALSWIYNDASKTEFNVDVYVPPVIPYAYDYLFRWYGGRVMGYEPKKEQVELLYTLYEVDPPHPERLNAWLARQKGIGTVEKEEKFGGIVVQRRKRI